MTRGTVRLRRVYEEPTADDGVRVLVDGLWPRGMSKERAQLDQWCKDVAPSADLRKWYHHDPTRFDEFTRRYTEELAESQRAEAFSTLRRLAAQGTVTLLTATRDVNHSEAAVLAGLLRGPSGTGRDHSAK